METSSRKIDVLDGKVQPDDEGPAAVESQPLHTTVSATEPSPKPSALSRPSEPQATTELVNQPDVDQPDA